MPSATAPLRCHQCCHRLVHVCTEVKAQADSYAWQKPSCNSEVLHAGFNMGTVDVFRIKA